MDSAIAYLLIALAILVFIIVLLRVKSHLFFIFAAFAEIVYLIIGQTTSLHILNLLMFSGKHGF